jgi:carbon storage regulator
MLVLTRKSGEKVVIGGITLTVVAVDGGRVRLAFEAPAQVRIRRGELAEKRRTARVREDDPDLAAKPGEWEDAEPDVVLDR